MKAILAILAGIVVVVLANQFDVWYVTVLVGAITPLWIARGGRAVLASLLTGFLGWGIPLLWAAPLANVVKLATLLGGILGLSGAGATIVGLLVPSLTGALLALGGAWIVVAARAVFVTTVSWKAMQPEKITLHS